MSEGGHKLLPTTQPLRVGCVGGGQLGRMMALEAPRLNIAMSFLDPTGEKCPAAMGSTTSCADIIEGKLTDAAKLRELAEGKDVVTMEIEHVGVETLRQLEEEGVNVQPSARVVGLIQDKYLQKDHFHQHGIPVSKYKSTPDIASIQEAARTLGLPLMLKSRRGAYDGRGNAVLRESDNLSVRDALTKLGCSSSEGENADDASPLDLYAEGWVDFHQEVAVMVVRSANAGEVRSYPPVTAVQTDSICRVVVAPARDVPPEVQSRCEVVARDAISSLGDGATGVFGVELFVVRCPGSDGGSGAGGWQIWLNEVAPRPHNTGHYTQDACATSQFENHLRAVAGLPLGDVKMNVGAAAMVNILGAPSGDMDDTMKTVNLSLSIPRAVVHWYGKLGCRAGRKMGHINITADSPAELDPSLDELLKSEGINADETLPYRQTKSKDTQQRKRATPLVGVIMGSSSDLPCMQAGVQILTDFGIPCEVDIVSAHRTPEKLVSYSRAAAGRGLEVIVAGAGGAAHLPGMVASLTPLPVVGVPIKTSTLNGQDSLLSIVQMPRGIPVATVAIGNATNAGLLAVRILAATRPELRGKMEAYQAEMRRKVEATSDQLLEEGSTKFLEGMDNKNTAVNV